MSLDFLEVAIKYYNEYSPRKCAKYPLQRSEKHSATFVSLKNVEGIRVLERAEYKKILEIVWIELKARQNGEAADLRSLVLWGQPGIGKSMFLDYALVMAIHDKKFTIYSDNPERVIVFNPLLEPYPLKVAKLRNFKLPNGCLVLSDSTADFSTPLNIFTRRDSSVFVLQATCSESRYRSWAKHRLAMLYPMDPLPKDEFLLIVRDQTSKQSKATTSTATSQESEFFTPEELYDLLGPMAPPALVRYSRVKNPKPVDLDLVDPADLFMDLNWRSVPRFHQYFVITPDSTRPKPVFPMQPGHRYTVATPFLRRLLVEHLRSLTLEKRMQIAASLTSVAQVAGALFEAHMPIYLSRYTSALQLHFNDTHSDYALGPRLVLSQQLFDADGRCRPELNTLYIPKRNQPTFDAFCVTNIAANALRVTILRATIARKHKIVQKDICQLMDALDLQGDVEWRFVFVTPSTEISEAVSTPFWNGGVPCKGMTMTIPVGWAVMPLPESGVDSSEPYLTATELLNDDYNSNESDADFEEEMEVDGDA
ncbi:hypothetical protein MKEN_00354500 [Mycena kentingensis (nom. inval.)]|nr:hypothetical protein MKEN_00354500 [Mycena kentingensis (nom. inval.)]